MLDVFMQGAYDSKHMSDAVRRKVNNFQSLKVHREPLTRGHDLNK